MVPCCAICYKQWGPTGDQHVCYLNTVNHLSSGPAHLILTETSLSIFDQPYAAAKAREYLDKPAIHETMVKVINFWPSFIFPN